MDRYTFPGYPAFLERAAEELGLVPSPARGSSPGPLAAMANLCAQASTAEAAHVDEILAEAATFRDRLLVAARAAGLMLSEVVQASTAAATEPPPAAPPAPARSPRDPGTRGLQAARPLTDPDTNRPGPP